MEKKLIKLSFIILLSISMTLMLSITGWADLTKESEKCLSSQELMERYHVAIDDNALMKRNLSP